MASWLRPKSSLRTNTSIKGWLLASPPRFYPAHQRHQTFASYPPRNAPRTTATSLIHEINNNTYLLSGNDKAAKKKIIAAAEGLIQELETPGEQLIRILWEGPGRTAALRVAFDLGILKKLSDKPQTSGELIEGTGADPVLIERLLRHLAATGSIKQFEKPPGKETKPEYVATPLSLASEDPGINGGLAWGFEGIIPLWTALPDFLKKREYQTPTGQTALQHIFDTKNSVFELFAANPRLGSAFNNFMSGYTKTIPSWVDQYNVQHGLLGPDVKQGGNFLVEMGGSLGQGLLDLQSKHPDLPGQLVLQDLPSVVEETKRMKLEGITVAAQDFFKPQPVEFHGARAYVIRRCLHNWSDEDCIEILTHVRDAMEKGYSKLIICESIMREKGAIWQLTGMDLLMMAAANGKERTLKEWQNVLGAAGLKTAATFDESVIEAVVA